jgi:hypothetical protein
MSSPTIDCRRGLRRRRLARKVAFDSPDLTPFTGPECHGVLAKIVETD